MSAARRLNPPLRAAERTYLLRHGSVAAESREDRSLSVIDADGRIQLPPGWNELFQPGRAEIVVEEDSMRIVPPWSYWTRSDSPSSGSDRRPRRRSESSSAHRSRGRS